MTNKYQVVDVILGDEDQISQTYLRQRATMARARYAGDTIPNEPYLGVIRSAKKFNQIIQEAGKTDHPAEIKLEAKALMKWIYEQGGSFSYDQLVKNAPEYFEPREIDDSPTDAEIRFCQFLHDTFFPESYGISVIRTNARKIYVQWKGDHRSNAGLTYLGDRRTPGVPSEAIRQAMNAPYNIDASIGGMRLKDNKYRNIFNDSFANYFREAQFLSKLFDLWHQLPYDSNKGDLRCSSLIRKFQAKDGYEGDYKAMDQHHCYYASVRLMRCVQVIFGVSTLETAKIIFWLQDLHQQAVLFGDKLWIPETFVNLLSGLYPTHDFEGMENLIILGTTAQEFGLVLVTEPKKLKKNECFIGVCGDDSYVLFGDRMPASFPERHAYYASLWGQIVEVEKVDHDSDHCFFCKKSYALRDTVSGYKHITYDGEHAIIPKYSIRKAANSIYHPENFPNFQQPVEILIWFCMIWDNVAGMKYYRHITKIIVDGNPDLFTFENICQIDNYELTDSFRNYLRSDWWTNMTWQDDWIHKSITIALLHELVKEK